ncbi:MAG: hypothetical protein LLG97_19680 [Deltaproteobacteria bacterium]|nr:hypothetical protein [Deltaproteobacteria bacterium]
MHPDKLIHRLQPIIIALLCLLAFPAVIAAADDPKETAEILDAAEAVFQKMAAGDFPALWRGLTSETQRNIIRNVRKAEGKIGHDYTEEQIRHAFQNGEPLAREYWKAYLTWFDPKTVLKESQWSMGKVNRGRAEIILRYHKSDHDALLKMFREEGRWKVGLDETFSARQ